MPVPIRLYANLRRVAGVKSLQAEAATVRQALVSIWKRYPALGEAILDDGALRPHVRVMVNGIDVELGNGLDTRLKEGDEIAIFPPIGGGEIQGTALNQTGA